MTKAEIIVRSRDKFSQIQIHAANHAHPFVNPNLLYSEHKKAHGKGDCTGVQTGTNKAARESERVRARRRRQRETDRQRQRK